MNTLQKLEKLTKWRSVFAAWQLGTRGENDGELRAVKDHREVTIILRAEMNALVNLLVEKGVFTLDEWTTALGVEAVELDKNYERKFDGYKSTPDGMHMDVRRVRAMMATLNFPP